MWRADNVCSGQHPIRSNRVPTDVHMGQVELKYIPIHSTVEILVWSVGLLLDRDFYSIIVITIGRRYCA